MSPGELSASSFEFYEGIRIIIPGTVCVALYGAIVATFGLDAPSPDDSLVAAAIAALVVGLLLLFIDAPARSIAYLTDLPDRALHNWGLELPAGGAMVNLYFVLLDTDLPAGIRNRALYMGSIFRIGFELVYLLFLAALAVISLAFLVPDAGESRSDANVTTILWVGLSSFVALFVVALILDNQRSRKGNRARLAAQQSPTKRWPVLLGQISPLDWVLGALSVVLSVVYQASGAEILAALAIAILAGIWATRYFRGARRVKGEGHEKLAMPVAALWYCGAGGMMCWFAATNFPAGSSLSVVETTGWLAVALFAGALMVSRGPERKLRGSYSTQRMWFQLNEARLKAKYTAPSDDLPPPP